MAGSEKYITVNSVFVQYMKELEGGVFLSQLIYWADKGGRQDGWFYKKDKDWEHELGIKRRAIERATKLLKERGVLSVKVMKDYHGIPTKHYKIDYNVLYEELVKFMRQRTNEQVQTDKTPNRNVQTDNLEMHKTSNGIVQNDNYETSHMPNGNVQNSISSYTEITTKNTTYNVVDASPTPAKKSKRTYEEHEEPLILAKYLYELMKRNNRYAKAPNFQEWANHIRLMHEVDGIEYSVIKNCITWCQSDPFWYKNILSTKKLREKFQTLYLQAQHQKGGNAYAANRNSIDVSTHSTNQSYADGLDF